MRTKTPTEIIDSLRLNTSKGRFFVVFCIMLVFFLIALTVHFSSGIFDRMARAAALLFCPFGMVVCAVGVFTNKYDAVLTSDGIKFGTFSGRRYYLWDEIKAVYVLRETTGRRVCLELKTQKPTPSGRIRLKSLPDTYGMDADELAKLLLRWQREHTQPAQNN